MIDYFALALTHALILIGVIRLVGRKDLDEDPALPVLRKKRAWQTQAEIESDKDA